MAWFIFRKKRIGHGTGHSEDRIFYRMNSTTPEAAQALEALRVAGFKVTSHTVCFRLVRSDGSQAPGGNLGLITGDYDGAACIAGLKIARALLADESARVQ